MRRRTKEEEEEERGVFFLGMLFSDQGSQQVWLLLRDERKRERGRGEEDYYKGSVNVEKEIKETDTTRVGSEEIREKGRGAGR